ncbi:hypothetical protein [Streptomyces sp. WY228]|uniref:hypothetical protein n=1 Tax=Streptomyces sp. WY228 TaxID=2855836 RepID=UPI00099E14DF|nr:hypothetical protein [Streptomyces sp. WY228]QXR01798.1 hypothetical protein KV381_01480 [Streptomyces sp. WY228]
MSETTEPNVGAFTLGGPLAVEPAAPVEVPEHEEWPLPNGFAWVFPGEGNRGDTSPRPTWSTGSTSPNSAWTDGDRHPPRRTRGPPLTSPSTAGG